MQDYVTKHHFELLEQWKEKEIGRSSPEQSVVNAELKNAYQVTEDWAKQVAARVFPNGYIKLVKNPTNQAGRFTPYNWAKIYPAPDSPTQLAYTVGIGAAGIFLVKIDTVGLSESDPVRQAYLSLRGEMDNSSPFVAVLTMEEGLTMALMGSSTGAQSADAGSTTTVSRTSLNACG